MRIHMTQYTHTHMNAIPCANTHKHTHTHTHIPSVQARLARVEEHRRELGVLQDGGAKHCGAQQVER
jgi:hypothetical protein